MSIRDDVLKACKKKTLFMTHALDQMNSPERMISKDEVKEVVTKGRVIEDYPDDSRGHSCLMAGETRKQRTIHVVCCPKNEYLAVITAYVPSQEKWKSDLKTRRR